MRLRNYFVVGAICAILLIAWVAAAQNPRTGNGLTFKGHPVVLAIPQGHPDFTTWNINSKMITEEVVLLGLVLSGFGPIYYELIVCENRPMVLALHFHDIAEDLYWLYTTNVTLVKATSEEFEKMKTEAHYLCPERKRELKPEEV